MYFVATGMNSLLFFFSSRRRHTRLTCDWSSDVCSSDLLAPDAAVYPLLPHDADVMLESVGADLVLIEAAAMLASSAWAYAGDPAAVDRGRRLGRLIAG